MARVTVWRCDKCKKEVEQSDKPGGWAEAEVQAPPNNRIIEDDTFNFLWCDTCWGRIKQPLEKVIDGTRSL